MYTQVAVVNSDNEDIRGTQVEIKDGKITYCPGCGQENVGTTIVMGVTLISHHLNHKCPYNGEIVKYISKSNPIKDVSGVQ